MITLKIKETFYRRKINLEHASKINNNNTNNNNNHKWTNHDTAFIFLK